MEHIITGYCRAQDQSRTVFFEYDDGEWDCGCDYPGCAYVSSCTLAKQMAQIEKEAEA